MIYRSPIPPGRSGEWSVREQWDDHGPGKGLYCGDVNWMSDSPAEVMTHAAILRAATGEVLVSGLGLGVVADLCCRKPDVRRVTVLENSYDVIMLVGPTLAGIHCHKIRVLYANAHEWTPDVHFDAAWHDIGPDPTATPAYLESAKRLIDRYQPYVTWQGAWAT